MAVSVAVAEEVVQSPQGDTYAKLLTRFAENAQQEIDRIRRNFAMLSADDCGEMTWPAEEQVKSIQAAIADNMSFLEALAPIVQGRKDLASMADVSVSCRTLQDLLQRFTREWSAEGLLERGVCHDKLLGALDRHFDGQKAPKVLIPGASLGRIAFDAQKRGYVCSASDASPVHVLGAELVRKGTKAGAHTIRPFALFTCNRFAAQDHVRNTPLPDVDLATEEVPVVRHGDFLTLHGQAGDRAAHDALVTAFCLDNSPNILRFVRTAAHCVRPGGMWANFGPLAYDTDHDDGHGIHLELSWEELRHAISHFFEVKEEEFVDSFHNANGQSMMLHQYSCVYFSAVRNDVEAKGIGEQ